MACPFCATGQMGLTRNLSTAEIVDQVREAQASCRDGKLAGGPTTLSNVVFMGMGEPLANYKTVVEKVGDGKNAKSKASGGRRVLYTTHHACWDAKNRFDLPEEVPFDYASIAACIPGAVSAQAPKPEPRSQPEADILPSPQPEAKPVAQPQPTPPQESSSKADMLSLGVPEKLAALMSANKVSCEELQAVVGKRGYFPEDMPIKDYPADFVEGCLIGAWPQVFQMVLDNRDIPF